MVPPTPICKFSVLNLWLGKYIPYPQDILELKALKAAGLQQSDSVG